MKEINLWKFIRTHLAERTSVMLIVVVESHGASPGRAGFKMAVAATGDRCGTIGGGIMEVNWVDYSKQQLANKRTSPDVRKLHHSQETRHESSGLICSGSQTILLQPLSVEDVDVIDGIIRAFDNFQYGILFITPNEIQFLSKQRNGNGPKFIYDDAHKWEYKENAGVLDTVYIVGSGHVGLALSRVMSTLDFRVVTLDDRSEAATFVSNSFAHQKIHTPYDSIGEIVEGNGREFVAVVTTAYKSDAAALKALVGKHVKYIGLMGSPAKTKKIFEVLREQGVDDSWLSQIRHPIGLPIASHTPEEIAISIAGEIIKIRNQSND